MRVEKRLNEVVNRLNKTKVEKTPDLKGKLLAFFFIVDEKFFWHISLRKGEVLESP